MIKNQEEIRVKVPSSLSRLKVVALFEAIGELCGIKCVRGIGSMIEE